MISYVLIGKCSKQTMVLVKRILDGGLSNFLEKIAILTLFESHFARFKWHLKELNC